MATVAAVMGLATYSERTRGERTGDKDTLFETSVLATKQAESHKDPFNPKATYPEKRVQRKTNTT